MFIRLLLKAVVDIVIVKGQVGRSFRKEALKLDKFQSANE